MAPVLRMPLVWRRNLQARIVGITLIAGLASTLGWPMGVALVDQVLEPTTAAPRPPAP